MSRFLGPIHYHLFGRVEVLNNLSDFLILKGKEKQENFFEDIEIENIPNKPLDQILDLMNIHSSLSGLIDIVETKYAVVVKALLSIFNFDEIKDLVFDFGRTIAYEGENNIEEVNKKIDATLLDGMPCDRVTEIVSSDEKTLIWKYSKNLHELYFIREGIEENKFFVLRLALLRGIFNNVGIEVYYEENRTYKVVIK